MNERDRQLIDALQDSLERIEAGLSPAEALARHADLREDLTPRLEAAMTVRAHRPAAAPAFDASFRARLEAVDAEASRGMLLAFDRWQAPLLRAAAVILAVGLALGTAGYAAAARLPEDHWLRPLALRIDRVREVVWEAAESVLPDGMRPALHDAEELPLVDLDHASSEAIDSDAADAGRSADAVDSDGDRDRDVSKADGVSPILRQADARGLAAGQLAPVVTPKSAPASVPPDLSFTATASPSVLRPTQVASLPEPAQPTVQPPAAPPEPTDEPKDDPPKELPKPTDVPTATAAPPGPPSPTPGSGNPGDPVDPDPPTTGVIEGVARWWDGRPLFRNFRVVVIPADGCRRGPGGPNVLVRTKTDDEGRFRIEGLPAGGYKVGLKVGDGERGQEFYVWSPSEPDCDRAEVKQVVPGQTLEVEIRFREPRGGGGGGPGGSGPNPPGRDPGHEPPAATPEPTSDPAGG